MTPAALPPSFADLLASAVTEPGILSSAYQQFHNYSIGNQLLAWSQCLQRGMQPGPMATFPRWKELGRYVRKGEEGHHALSTGHDQANRRGVKRHDRRRRDLDAVRLPAALVRARANRGRQSTVGTDAGMGPSTRADCNGCQ